MKGRIAAVLAAATSLLAGCAAQSAVGTTSDRSGHSRTVNVFAAASLKGSFGKLGARFQAAHPGTRIVFDFGPSSGLAQQIIRGAPADVFASASLRNMAQVVGAKQAANPRTFARNVLEIAVPPGNPGRVRNVADLARPGLKVAVCQPQVPCGQSAATVFARAKLSVRAVTEEVDVKAVLSKVQLGEVDAGVVYVTDVRAAGSTVDGIAIPPTLNAATSYPIATLRAAADRSAAQAFVDYVLSPAGAAVLRADGFAGP